MITELGKSTLIKTVSGYLASQGGTDLLGGAKKSTFTAPRAAADLGIATVYQDLALCDNLDIVQNMYLGSRRDRALGCWTRSKWNCTTRKLLNDLSVSTVRSVRQLVGSLSGGQRQAVAVARAVMRQSELMILDEPTGRARCHADWPGPRPHPDAGFPRHRRVGHFAQPQRCLCCR